MKSRRVAALALVSSAGRAIAESVVAGLAVGLVEAAWVASGAAGQRAIAAWLVLGLVVVAAAIVGPIAIAAGALVGASAPVAAWRARWRAGGGDRVAAVVHAGVAAIAAAALAVATWRIAAWTHRRFHEPEAIGILEGASVLVLAIAIGLGAIEIGGRAGRRAAAWPAPRRWLDGARGTILGAGVVVALASGALAIGRAVVPAFDWGLPAVGLGFAGALVAVRAAGARWPGGRRRGALVAAAAVAAAAGLAMLPRAPAARAAVVGLGVGSELALRTVWRAVDGDGDGYAPGWIGGTDCDDGDGRRHPGAADVADNGVDENCTGRDFRAEDLAHRRGARRTAFRGAPRHNVLLVSIDALRPDHLGAWGYRRPTSPTIDALAARSTRFAAALTTSPTTRRAIPSLLTGRYASALPWKRTGRVRMDETRLDTIAERLAAQGWDTAAISCCERLFGEEQGGAIAGVAHVDVSADAIRRQRDDRYNGDAVADRVVAWLATRRGQTRPFFLWTHFIDVHAPYTQLPGAPDFGARAADRYDAEIAFVDAQLARILDALAAAGLAGSTIVVVTADHGEELGEHGSRFHGKTLWSTGTRIPLVIHDPGAPARVVDTPVSLADVTPTILDLLGVDGPAGMNGLSLAATVRRGEPAPARPLLVELIADYEQPRSMLALHDGPWKLTWDRDADAWSLHDLADDPGEERDLADARPDLVERLRDAMRSAMDVELSPL